MTDNSVASIVSGIHFWLRDRSSRMETLNIIAITSSFVGRFLSAATETSLYPICISTGYICRLCHFHGPMCLSVQRTPGARNSVSYRVIFVGWCRTFVCRPGCRSLNFCISWIQSINLTYDESWDGARRRLVPVFGRAMHEGRLVKRIFFRICDSRLRTVEGNKCVSRSPYWHLRCCGTFK